MHRESPCFPRLGGEEKPTYSEFFVKPARARAKKEKKRGATIKHEELEESKIQSSVSITDSATHVFPFPDHHFPFLYLPPELRNKVYKYAFGGIQFVVEFIPRCSDYSIIPTDLYWFESPQRPDRHPRYNVLRYDINNWHASPMPNKERSPIVNWPNSISALHLANKQLHRETVFYLYSKPTFYFQCLTYAGQFMNIVRRHNALESISSLSLGLQTEEPPTSAKHIFELKRSYEALSNNITEMAKRMPKVKKLAVVVEVREEPLAFTFREQWVQPILQFSKFKDAEEIQIKIQSPELREEKNRDMSAELYFEYRERTTLEKETYSAMEQLHTLFGEALTRRVEGDCESCAIENLFSHVTDDDFSLCQRLKKLHVASNLAMFRQALDWSWVDHGDLGTFGNSPRE